MQYGPPPLFNQGLSARARLAFFSFLAVALIIVDSRLNALEKVRLGVGAVLYPLQQAMLVPGAMMQRVDDYFTSIGQLSRENEQLRREAAERSPIIQQSEALVAENAQLRQLLGVRERLGSSTLVAQVLYEVHDRFSRKVVIDKGAAAALAAGAPVVDDRGVVGQVTRVFPASSEVTLLTDKDQTIPVQILRNGLRGVAYGGIEPGTLDLRFMAVNADISNGDLVVTSGLDGTYPPGLAVAHVVRVERNVKDQFARVVLSPAAGVQNHVHLLVLQTDPAQRPARLPARQPEKRERSERPDRKGARK